MDFAQPVIDMDAEIGVEIPIRLAVDASCNRAGAGSVRWGDLTGDLRIGVRPASLNYA